MSPVEVDRPSRKPYPETPSGIMRLPASFRAAAAAARYFDPTSREAQAESITVRIRWFGLCVGCLYVNLIQRENGRPELNGMLALGAVYALVDTLASWKGKVLLKEYRIGISLMEALFIGLLCNFDQGVSSPFRFYYFLSVLVCAIRHSPRLTFATFGLHSVSYIVLGMYAAPQQESDYAAPQQESDIVTMILTLVFLGWAAWAIIALTGLLRSAGQKLVILNEELQSNQQLLERRIAVRTKELQESQAMLVQQEKQAAFGLLAAGIAHEVGNPLASISSIIQMLSRKNSDEYVKQRLDLVDGQLTRIQRTLRELTGFSRPTNQQQSTVDVHAAINDALNIAKYYKRWKGKTIVSSFARNLPHIRTVYDQLVQVMLNLILNALDATNEGAAIEITTELIADTDSVPARIGIRVRDEGHGIPRETQEQIFQPYYTTKDHGTGLGLFVCRQLTRHALGGEITLIRSTHQGTEFFVTLPAVLDTGSEVGSHSSIVHAADS